MHATTVIGMKLNNEMLQHRLEIVIIVNERTIAKDWNLLSRQ